MKICQNFHKLPNRKLNMNLCICFQPANLKYYCRYLVPCKVKGSESRGSDEAGVLEELDEDLVDKLVLGNGLHHQHPLLPQPGQHGGNLHGLVVLQAADHELSEDDHSGATHAGTTVNHHRWIEAL